MPRPSLIADPITAYGRRKPAGQQRPSILEPVNRAAIRPKPEQLLRPLQPYLSARDVTRAKVQTEIRRSADQRNAGGIQAITTDRSSMDILLPRLHRTQAERPTHRHLFFVEPSKY